MATKKNNVPDNMPTSEEIEQAIAAEFSENDDIVEYIEDDRLSALKSRYAALDEDENIRSEGFDLAPKSGLIKKQRPGGFGYYYDPQFATQIENFKKVQKLKLSEQFDTAESAFDNNEISFKDISLDIDQANRENIPLDTDDDLVPADMADEKPIVIADNLPDETPAEEVEQPVKRGRGRPKKIVEPTEVEATQEAEPPVKRGRGRPKKIVEPTEIEATQEAEPPVKRGRGRPKKIVEPIEVETTQEAEPPVKRGRGRPKKITQEEIERIAAQKAAQEAAELEAKRIADELESQKNSMSKTYNTHTKVVYVDQNTNDGIKRNSDEELSEIFAEDTNKRHGLFGLLRRKK